MSSFDPSSTASSSSSSLAGGHPANIRVLVRVRPFNENETRFGRGGGDRDGGSGIIEIDDTDMKSAIDFGGGSSPVGAGGRCGTSSWGRVVIVDPYGGAGGGGGYGSGYDSGTNAGSASQQQVQQRSFTYDAVYGPTSSQSQIFYSVRGIVNAVCDGYNGTIVAYGQTGSGKTHTVFGSDDDDENAGLVQRALSSIFERISNGNTAGDTNDGGSRTTTTTTTTTKASFFEIYNERVYDLLSPNTDASSMEDDRGLPVREDSVKGVYVEGLYEWEVNNTEDSMAALRVGMSNRSVASTNMNRSSSRSHAVFVLSVRTATSDNDSVGVARVRHSKFTLVDLAGSERQRTTAADGERLREANMINGSLLVLGKVINSLVDRERGGGKGPNRHQHVQFRDSKLTFLLRDSFGGNSKTCLVATVSPSASSLSETISTLTFAQRAKLITNTAVLNENTSGSVPALQAEIVRLRAELERQSSSNDDGPIFAGDGGGGSEAVDDQGMATSSSLAKSAGVADVTVNALRDQNAKLSKRVKVLGDVNDKRAMHVNLLKRKLQQETLIRKCKERRITYYLSKKDGRMMAEGEEEEIAALREEVAALRDQLDATPSEVVEYMIKYKETKAMVEELEEGAIDTDKSPDEKSVLQASLVSLLNERDSLQQKVQSLSDERNLEIDNIIKDVTTLEDSNVVLQSRLDEKEFIISSNLDNIRMNESQIDGLREEVKAKVASLESIQLELEAEKEKTIELRESVDCIKIEVKKAKVTLIQHKEMLTVAEEEMARMAESHNEYTTELNKKLGKMQDDIVSVMNENESLVDKLKQALEDLQCAKSQLKDLEQLKNDEVMTLKLVKEQSDSDLQAFKVQEEALRANMKKMEATIESLLAEKSHVAANLENVTANNALLQVEVKTLELERDVLQRRTASLDKLHEHAAMLEDEVAFLRIEAERTDDGLDFNEADHDRTIRFQEHLFDAQTAAHMDELVLRDASIDRLSKETGGLQNKLVSVSQQLSRVTEASEDKMSLLETNLENVTANNALLHVEVKTLKLERDVLQQRMASLDKLHEHAAILEDEVAFYRIEAERTDDGLDFNEADHDRTIRFQEHLFDAQTAAHMDELVLRDASIERLSQETGGLQNKLVSVSQQLSRVTEATEDKISLLEKSISELRDKITCMEADAKMADETVKILRENEVQIAQRLKLANDEGERAKIKLQESSNAKITELQADLDAALRSTVSLTDQLKVSTHSKSLSEKVKADLELECRDLHKRVASLTKFRDDIDTLEDEMEFATFAKSHVEDKLNFAIFDLDRTSRLLNLRDDDLADQDEIIARISGEKEMLQKHVATISKQLEAKDFKLHLNMKIQAGIECERGALISREDSLKAIIEALEGEKDASEKEDAALREQSNANPSSASSPSENSSPWGSSPIKSIDEALRDTAFGADDTFDESMFLPNVDVETDIPQTGNISTPPKTPTEEELVLSSPRSRERSAHKAQTPAKRLTRAMRNKLRTPLGKSAVQNTPLSTSMSTKKFTRASSRKKHTKI